MDYRIALFGESEKGAFQTAYFCDTLPQLVDFLGNPPHQSHGLFCAIQALMYHTPVIYFRVHEEGFSTDYMAGIHLLLKENLVPIVHAFFLPGVGDRLILDEVAQLCVRHKKVLITREADFYDYLTHAK